MADKQPTQSSEQMDPKRLGRLFDEAQRRDGRVTISGLSALAKKPEFGGYSRIGLGT